MVSFPHSSPSMPVTHKSTKLSEHFKEDSPSPSTSGNSTTSIIGSPSTCVTSAPTEGNQKWNSMDKLDDFLEDNHKTDSYSFRVTKPVPREIICRCRVVLVNKFHIVLTSETGRFILSASRRHKSRSSYYAITGDPGGYTGIDNPLYIGKLRSNFVGSEYRLFSPGSNPSKTTIPPFRSELLAIRYRNKLIHQSSKKGPRRMTVCMRSIDNSISTYSSEDLMNATRTISIPEPHTGIESFRNVDPQWNVSANAYILPFPSDRVKISSVKNLILSQAFSDPGSFVLVFGKCEKSMFALDFGFPFSPLQAFAVALSSLDFKLCSQ